MTEAERHLLPGEARWPGAGWSAPSASSSVNLPRAVERPLELDLLVEMVLDHGLVAAGDEDEMLDAGLARLIHDC